VNQNLEDRLIHALQETADSATDRRGDVSATWQRTVRIRRRRKAIRIMTSTTAAVALLATGIGVFALRDHRPTRTVAAATFDPNFRLLPTWLPEDIPLDALMVESGNSPTDLPPGFINEQHPAHVRQWAGGLQSVLIIEEYPSLPVASLLVSEPTVDLSRNIRCETSCNASGANSKLSLSISANQAVTPEQFKAFVRSLTLNESTFSVPAPPFGLPLIFDRSLQNMFWFASDSWTVRTAPELSDVFGLSAGKSENELTALNGPEQSWSDGELIEVRGLPARLTSSNDVSFVVNWREHGWDLSVVSNSAENVKRIAEGLRVATDAEFDLRKVASSDFGKKYQYSLEAPSAEVFAKSAEINGRIKIAKNETVSSGCTRMLITGGTTNEEICLHISEDPVLWSGVRAIGDKKVLIVASGSPADAAALVPPDSVPFVGPVKTSAVGAVEMQVAFVQGGGRSYWVGISRFVIDDTTTHFELFANAVNDETEINDEGEPKPTPSGDQLLTSLGLFPIPAK
jgi:hypothetical protein